MSLLERVHGGYVYGRRVRTLSGHLARLLPPRARVLDVGCGDGLMAQAILERRPDLDLRGIDVLVRPRTHIPVSGFDGRVIPYGEASFDVVMFVDMLHHTPDPMVLLREALRTARRAIVIKDHTRDGWLAGPTLRLMDYVGNARHGVALPFNYWSRRRWQATFQALGLRADVWENALGIYPRPARWLFDRSLHFLARLSVP